MPSECAVLRCREPSASRVPLPEPTAVQREVAVCRGHREAIDGGTPWSFNMADNVIFMGADLAPEILDCRVTESGGDDHVLVALTVDGPDGDAIHEFRLLKANAKRFGLTVAGDPDYWRETWTDPRKRG